MTWGLKFAKFRFKAFAANRKDFYEDFAMALRDGAATIDLLKTRAQRARRRRTGLAPLYEHWLHKMRRMSFGYALQQTVPAFETMVLTAAEEEGRIDEAMNYLGRSIEIKGKTQSIYFVSLASPIISAVVLLGFLISYALVIAPEYLQILPLEKWPALTKSIYFLSSALVNSGVFFMALCAASFAAVMWSRPNWYGRIRKRIERLPFNPWSSYRDNESNNFLIALSILLQSNNHGIKEARSEFGEATMTAQRAAERGESLGQFIRTATARDDAPQTGMRARSGQRAVEPLGGRAGGFANKVHTGQRSDQRP